MGIDSKRFEGKNEKPRHAIAEEEIVARACEDRLANSRLMKEFIAEMDKKESGLAQKFSNFLGEAIARLKKLFQQIFSTLSRSKEAASLRQLTDRLEAIQSQYDALLEHRNTANAVENQANAEETTSEQQKNTSARGVMSAERKVAKNKKTGYNEYRTNAMQWANSFGRSQDDRAIFFDPIRNNYYFIAPSSDSDMGYIELAFGTKNEMEEINEEYERTYNAHTLSGNIDKDIQRIRDEQNDDDWDNDFPRYIDEEKKDDGLSSDEIRRKADSDRTRNPSRTRENSKGIEESAAKGTMKADRGVMSAERGSKQNFEEDKYFARQIDQFESLKKGGYVTVGKIAKESPLNKIGIPDGSLYFDVSKIIKEMETRRDSILPDTMKKIPNVLNNPIVITEYVDKNGIHSANVYGKLFVGNSPIVIGVMISHSQKGTIVSKIQTVHPNRNFMKEMTDDNILYLSENKKETKSWFQSLGAQMPLLRENKFGFIRMLSQSSKSVKPQSSGDDKGEMKSDRGVMYMSREGKTKDASQLTEDDYMFLLERAENGELYDNTYIPMRATTPQFFIDVVQAHSGGKYKLLQVPMASEVEHVRQNMEIDEGQSYGNKRPHNLSSYDLLEISKGMGHPAYIVLQKNGRYAMVVSFYNEKHKKVIASIDFAQEGNKKTGEKAKNYKHPQYMNGYKDGYYNIIVTQYNPDNFKKYLSDNEIVYNKKEMNGRYQVGSGRIVTFTHDTPFINTSISNPSESVKPQNSGDDKGAMKADRGVMSAERDFSYEELVARDTLQGVIIDKTQHPKMINGIIDKNWVVKKVKEKCKSLTRKGGIVYYTDVPDIGRNVEIIAKGLTHGFSRPDDLYEGKSTPKAITNARVVLAIPQILNNSIEVNRSKRGDNIDVPYTHVLLGSVALENDDGTLEYYAVRSMVQERKNQNPVLIEFNILGRVTSVNAKKIGSPNAWDTNKIGVARTHGKAYTYKIADFLDNVKGVFDNTFSEDVYKHFRTERSDDSFSKNLMFSDRATYMTARELLLQAMAEKAKKQDEQNPLLREYANRVTELDKKYMQLEE